MNKETSKLLSFLMVFIITVGSGMTTLLLVNLQDSNQQAFAKSHHDSSSSSSDKSGSSGKSGSGTKSGGDSSTQSSKSGGSDSGSTSSGDSGGSSNGPGGGGSSDGANPSSPTFGGGDGSSTGGGGDGQPTTTTPTSSSSSDEGGGHHSSHHHHHHLSSISSSSFGGGGGGTVVGQQNTRTNAMQQIPSTATDYPTPAQSNDLKLVFVNSFKDILNMWHIKGAVQNTSPTQQTMSFLSVTATIYNSQQQPIDTENGYATVGLGNTVVNPGQTAPFDVMISPDTLGGQIPAFFKLSYSWQ